MLTNYGTIDVSSCKKWLDLFFENRSCTFLSRKWVYNDKQILWPAYKARDEFDNLDIINHEKKNSECSDSLASQNIITTHKQKR